MQLICVHTEYFSPGWSWRIPALFLPSRFRGLQNSKLLEPEVSVGSPVGSVVKNLPADAGDTGLIPGSGRSSGGGHSNPLQYSCLGNPMNRGAWWATCEVSEDESRGAQRARNRSVVESKVWGLRRIWAVIQDKKCWVDSGQIYDEIDVLF